MKKRLKLGYYCADVDPKRTKSIGIRNVTFHILRELMKFPDLEIYLILNEENKKLFDNFSCNKLIIPKKSIPLLLKKTVYYPTETNKLAKKLNLDILFFPKGHIPFTKVAHVKYISFIHDLIPFYYLKKGHFSFLPVSLLLYWSMKFSDLIFTNSEYSASEIKKYSYQKIISVPLGFTPPKKILLPKLKKDSYIFVIGNKNPHKNLEKSINLVKEYNAKYTANFFPFVASGNLDEEELAGYYKNAKFSLFLSDIEGFGLPFIESYFYETPVVFNNKTSLAEIGKGLPGACNLDDTKSIFHAIKEVLNDSKEHILEVKRNLSKKYNWKDCGKSIYSQLYLITSNSK